MTGDPMSYQDTESGFWNHLTPAAQVHDDSGGHDRQEAAWCKANGLRRSAASFTCSACWVARRNKGRHAQCHGYFDHEAKYIDTETKARVVVAHPYGRPTDDIARLTALSLNLGLTILAGAPSWYGYGTTAIEIWEMAPALRVYRWPGLVYVSGLISGHRETADALWLAARRVYFDALPTSDSRRHTADAGYLSLGQSRVLV